MNLVQIYEKVRIEIFLSFKGRRLFPKAGMSGLVACRAPRAIFFFSSFFSLFFFFFLVRSASRRADGGLVARAL